MMTINSLIFIVFLQAMSKYFNLEATNSFNKNQNKLYNHKIKKSNGGMFSYSNQQSWPNNCLRGSRQSPIRFQGSRSEIPQTTFTFDMIPNQKEITTKFELINNQVTLIGEFINFTTKKTEPGRDIPVYRNYINKRIEIHTPCEHEVNNRRCSVEMQFFCEEVLDASQNNPIENVSNLAFSLFFDVSNKGVYFSDGFQVMLQGQPKSFINTVMNNQYPEITKNSPFQIDIMNALKKANMIPIDKNKQNSQVFFYHGSMNKPPCDENVYWFGYQETLDINDYFVKFLQQHFLSDESIFPQRQNARNLSENNKAEFKMVTQASSHLKGLDFYAPLYTKNQVVPGQLEGPLMEVASFDFHTGSKIVSLQNKQLKVTNYQTKDSFSSPQEITKLLQATPNFVFASDNQNIIQYNLTDRSLVANVIETPLKGCEYFAFQNEVNNQVRMMALYKQGHLQIQELKDQVNKLRNPQISIDISVMRWSEDNSQLVIGDKQGNVHIYSFTQALSLIKDVPVQHKIFDTAIIDLIYEKPNLIAASQSGQIAFVNVDFQCSASPKAGSIIIQAENESILSLFSISQQLFITASKTKIRLWDSKMKRLLKSGPNQPGFSLLTEIAQVYQSSGQQIRMKQIDYNVQQYNEHSFIQRQQILQGKKQRTKQNKRKIQAIFKKNRNYQFAHQNDF